MKRILYLLLLICCAFTEASAQKLMSAPRVMIVPDLNYCTKAGYTMQAAGATVPDYEKAMANDQTLNDAITLVSQLIKERNADIDVRDLTEAINNAKQDEAMAAANGGDDAESVDEAIIRNSEADILVKISFDVVKNGPQYQVTYRMNGVDAYTSSVFAPVSGMGNPSTSANLVVLLREAIFGNMDKFLNQMLTYYSTMVKKGRKVAFDIKVLSSSSVNMNSKVGQYTLREVIDDFLYDNTVEGGGLEQVKSGNTFMQYSGIYIPLTTNMRGRQRRQGVQDVAQRLKTFLEEKGIKSEFKNKGIGKVNFYIQ
mgnify:CR=1 FL=1